MPTATGPSAVIGTPEKNARVRREKARENVELAIDALRMAASHLSAVSSSEAARTEAECHGFVRQIKVLARGLR